MGSGVGKPAIKIKHLVSLVMFSSSVSQYGYSYALQCSAMLPSSLASSPSLGTLAQLLGTGDCDLPAWTTGTRQLVFWLEKAKSKSHLWIDVLSFTEQTQTLAQFNCTLASGCIFAVLSTWKLLERRIRSLIRAWLLPQFPSWKGKKLSWVALVLDSGISRGRL